MMEKSIFLLVRMIIKKWKKIKILKPKLKEMNINKNPKLNNGEVILEINGIKIKQILTS